MSPSLPEGMTADALRNMARWFDLYDEMADAYFSALVKGGVATEADVVKSRAAVHGREIQDDLLRWAALIDGAKS